MELIVQKTAAGSLIPVDEEGIDFLRKIKAGNDVKAKIVRSRNLKFHRKFFAMLDVGFNAWEPDEVLLNGEVAQKNRERFRKDCIILAGFYDLVTNLRGEVRAEARSISFANMDEEEFDAVYSAVADVLLRKVLTNYTREDLDQVVERVLNFT